MESTADSDTETIASYTPPASSPLAPLVSNTPALAVYSPEDASVAGTTTAATAAVILEDIGTPSRGGNLGTWLAVLIGVVLTGAIGALFIGKTSRGEVAQTADNIEIVEE